jgi:voltage-gated potassium channel
MLIIDAYLRLVARWRWSFLLALLIGSFVLQAILPDGPITRLTGFTLFMLVFGGALYAGRTGRRATRAAAVALLLGTGVLQVLNVLGVAELEGPLAVLALTIVLGALVATFAELVGNQDATADSLVGAIFGYFVIAAACALLFRQMEGAHPGSFRLPEGGDLDTQLLYFSIVTLTTAGYGDITPVTSVAQISAALEAALGTLYLAILIGRIVGQLAPRLQRSGAVPNERAPSHPGVEIDVRFTPTDPS